MGESVRGSIRARWTRVARRSRRRLTRVGRRAIRQANKSVHQSPARSETIEIKAPNNQWTLYVEWISVETDCDPIPSPGGAGVFRRSDWRARDEGDRTQAMKNKSGPGPDFHCQLPKGAPGSCSSTIGPRRP